MIRVVDSPERGYDNYQTRKEKGRDRSPEARPHPRKIETSVAIERKVKKTRLAISITLSSRVLGSDRI